MYFTKIIIILLAAAVTLSEEDKTFNLKIGFDLTNGENGMPALRIRDFEESAQHVASEHKEARKETNEKEIEDKKRTGKRSADKETTKVNEKAVVRAEDSSKSKSSNSKSSEDEKPKIREGAVIKSSETTPNGKGGKHKEGGKTSNSASKSRESIDEDSDAKALKHITKGMANPEEYEPEEKEPKVHEKDDDDDTRRSRRFKRQAFNLKKKHRGKKSSSGSKKITTKYRTSIV